MSSIERRTTGGISSHTTRLGTNMGGTEQTESNADSAGKVSLTDFLRARIAEDEAIARTASIGTEAWHLGEYDETVLWWPPSSPEKVERVREEFGDDLAAIHARWAGQTIESSGPKIAPHIARHDPARVLAECEAKRRIVDLAREARETQGAGYGTADAYMRDVLRLLALPYSEHRDYDDGWRP